MLSGYLIAKSWDQYPRFNVFLAKRMLRIFPGLIVAVVITIVICGLFFTSLPVLSFFLHQETLTYLNNFLLYNSAFTLPGVFESNIYPRAVNGSIWTLAYEFTMYLVIALIGVTRLYKKIPPFVMWLGLFLITLVMLLVGREHFSFVIFYLDVSQMLIFALIFFGGVIVYKYENRMKFHPVAGLIALLGFVGLSLLAPKIGAIFAATLLTYAVFALGRHGLMSWTSRFGDFSYGLYIYAFPVQQMIAALTHTTNALKMFALSFAVTFAISILSWYFVESRALKWKERINTKKYPLMQTDDAW